MKALIKVIAGACGVSPLVVYLVTGIAAAGGLGVVAWRVHNGIYDRGYAAGKAATMALWQNAVDAQRAQDARDNREARSIQQQIIGDLAAGDVRREDIANEVANEKADPADDSHLSERWVRVINRSRERLGGGAKR
jgi:hypothetical protein